MSAIENLPRITAQNLSQMLVKGVKINVGNIQSDDPKADSLAASYVAGVFSTLSPELASTDPHLIAQALHPDASFAVKNANGTSALSFPGSGRSNNTQLS